MKKRMAKNIQNRLSLALNIFLIIGMIIALFLVYEHFSDSVDEFCTFGESLNCGVVNKSPYANIDGISYLLTIDYKIDIRLINISGKNFILDLLTSNAFLGLLTLLFLFTVNTRYKNKDFLFIKKEDRIKWIRGILVLGVIYGLYLFYIQFAILKTYCPFCLALDGIMVLSLITAFLIKK